MLISVHIKNPREGNSNFITLKFKCVRLKIKLNKHICASKRMFFGCIAQEANSYIESATSILLKNITPETSGCQPPAAAPT
jgi:hypothetical protein